MSFKIKANIIDVEGGKAFSVTAGENLIFRSDVPHPVFFGDYGVYSSYSDASAASKDMIFRNRSFLSRVAQSNTSENIKSLMVDKYLKTLEFFQKVLTDIRVDEKDESYNNLNRTVPILQEMLDTTAGDGNQIDLVINEIENSTRLDYEPNEDGSVNEEDVVHHSSKYLLKIKDIMNKILERLRNDYPQFLKNEMAMSKYASDECDFPDICNEVASHYVHCACSACGMNDVKIEGVKDVCGDVGVICKGDSGSYVMVVIGTDLCFRGIIPMSGQCAPYSVKHYLEMIRPSVSAIGHMRPIGENFILVNKIKVEDSEDVFDAYDIEGKEPISVRINQVGGKTTLEPSFKYVTSSIKSASTHNDDLNEVARKISEAALVMVEKPGSKYNGMAGTVDPKKISIRNDHVEFPISLEYDTGVKVDLWVTNEESKIYR